MKINQYTPMRSIIIPLIAAGSIAGMAEASSGVRVHRLGDPPLPPRYMDTTPSSYYKKRATTPERLMKPMQPATTPSVANGGTRAAKRLPLAPGGFVPAPKPVAPAATPAPAPTQVVVAPPPAPAPTPAAAGVVSRPVSRYSRANVPVAAPTPAPAPAPAPTARRTRLPLAPTSLPAPTPAPKPAPVAVKPAPVVVTPAPAPKPVVVPAPAKQPVVKPAAAPAPAPAPAAKPRRRLPIAPVVVADGSTDLPPVPEALIRR